jgi:hypothetical protein
MLSSLPRVYPLLGFCSGYAIIMLFNPVRQALRDGFRCIARFKRIWVTFVVLGFAYAVFQFFTFTPIQNEADLDFAQITSLTTWQWPRLTEVWMEVPLPALESVAGLFDGTTTYPLSVVAAILLLINWRGLHGAFWRALRQRFRFWSYPLYLLVLASTLATLCKPIVFWKLPVWIGAASTSRLFQISATVDAVAFLFEYFLGVYIQVYLITVCFAWIRGLSFGEEPLFQFAIRRFSYVLKWSGLVMLVGILIVHLPRMLAYFMNIPDVLDYLPIERALMCGLILIFSSIQISLVLHNETLRDAMHAHRQFLRENAARFGWFLLIAGIHFFFLAACDAIVRNAIADRMMALLGWKIVYVCFRGLITGWLLASWVCLYRQCETGRAGQESWIQY